MKPSNETDTIIVGFEEYRKTATIKAIRLSRPFVVDTLKGPFTGKAGDWLAEGIDGERYIIDNEIFKKTCEVVEDA